MASTKIINVLKNDDPEEIFELFKKSDAGEVILILPKGSKFAKHEQYFELLKKESDSSGKMVSIMTGDPVIAKLVVANDLGLLQSPTPNVPQKTRITANPNNDKSDENPENDLKEFQEEPVGEMEEIKEETEALKKSEKISQEKQPDDDINQDFFVEEAPMGSEDLLASSAPLNDGIPEVILAASRNQNYDIPRGQGKIIRDILGGQDQEEKQIKVKTYKEPEFDLKIRRESFDEKKESELTQMWAQKPETSFFHKTSRTGQPQPLSKWPKKKMKIFTTAIVGALVFAVFILYTTLNSAKITIYPVKQKVDFQFKASASTAVSVVNSEINQIPGQKFTEQKEITETFSATGQKNAIQKAGGKITIYNTGISSQRLVATTRFESTNGKIFRIPATINVPGATKSGDKIIPGSITQVVYADKPGDEYNVPAGRFTIPGFKDTPKFNEFYATSEAPMSGGIIGQSKSITEGDYSNAQEKLTAKLKDEITASLKDKIGDLKIPDTVAIKIEPPITNAKAGDAANELKMTVKGSAEIVAFRETDVENLIKAYLIKNNGLEILQKERTISYENLIFSQDGSMLNFNLKVSGWGVAKIDPEGTKNDILGMSEEAIKNYFRGKKETIESAKIMLNPFWVKKIPKNAEKVTIILEKGE